MTDIDAMYLEHLTGVVELEVLAHAMWRDKEMHGPPISGITRSIK